MSSGRDYPEMGKEAIGNALRDAQIPYLLFFSYILLLCFLFFFFFLFCHPSLSFILFSLMVVDTKRLRQRSQDTAMETPHVVLFPFFVCSSFIYPPSPHLYFYFTLFILTSSLFIS